MSELRPCPQCRRHVRADETECPFCAMVLAPAAAAALPIGRYARAAVFAGAAVLTACGGAQKHDDKGQGPAATADAGATAESADAEVPVQVRPDHDVPMPYGAPPARQRLV